MPILPNWYTREKHEWHQNRTQVGVIFLLKYFAILIVSLYCKHCHLRKNSNVPDALLYFLVQD